MADARLEDGRGDPVLWIGLAACTGALVTVAPVVTIAAAGAIGVLLARRGARASALLAAFFFALAFGRARAVVARYEIERGTIVDAGAWPSRCTFAGVVTRSPVVAGGGMRLEVEAAAIRCRDGPLLRGRVTVHVPLDVTLTVARSDDVLVTAGLAPPYRFWNDGTGDPRPMSARRGVVLSGGAEDVVVVREGWGVRSWIDRARGHIRLRIDASFPAETAAMARALVLGEDDLATEDQRAFRKSGLAHLLAVSGMHLVLVVMGFASASRAVLARLPALAARWDVSRIAAAVGLPVAWIYADLAGGSGSAVRAAWMCTIVLLARALARRAAAWRALGLSLLAMSALDPLVVFDVSFVLSALATAGILALARPIEEALVHRLPRAPGFVVKPLATTAAATISCAPVLAMMAPELPLGGLVANVIAVPLGEAAALPLCLVHVLLSGWPSAESGCAAAASGALMLVRLVARCFTWGALPVPAPTSAELGALAFVAAAVAFSTKSGVRASALGPRGWVVLAAIALVLLEVAARREGAPRGSLRVTFLDVGQGDSALVDLPDGSAILIDGGGLVGSPIDVGERTVAPLLAARRRSKLDAVVLSHPHPDHFLGLSSALARVRTRTFWDTGQGEVEGVAGHYAGLLADLRARGVRVLNPVDLCGSHAFGGAVIEVLAPCPNITPDRGANDNSFVIRIRFGERAILFVGDAEHEEEAELVQHEGARLRADVLKVGHHGSRTSSSPAFVAAVAPSVAVISCGVRNRFGHPHEPTLQTFRRFGVRVLRTDRVGSVVVTTNGRSLDVRSMTGAR
jgi:competence protein ComEC